MRLQRPPEFDELIGRDVPPAERDRLRRVHDLLVASGPPPELSPELEKVPWPDEALQPLGLMRRSSKPRRPILTVLSAAAAVLAIGFFLGQAVGSKSNAGFDVVHTVRMHGIADAAAANGSIEVGARRPDGNWPMVVTITNLPPVAVGGYYDLWLSKHGRPAALCGTFNTKDLGDTVVRLSAAYNLTEGDFDGWVVTRHTAGSPESRAPVVLST